MRKRYWLIALVVVLAIYLYLNSGPKPGQVLDEPARAGVKPADLNPLAKVDVNRDIFHDMDGSVTLDKNEINGRNMWIVWTGGDDRLWDQIARLSFGTVDFVKVISSYDPAKDPTLSDAKRKDVAQVYKFTRDNRWNYLGVVNQPCYEKAAGPDSSRFGLWLDKLRPGCAPDPFEDETKYPGVRIGARGETVPVGSYYGGATGIVGLRLLPNPDFDEAAAKKWDPVRYYNDPSYYQSKDLVLPYRVGMSCGFCHVGPNPVRPPADPENPEWANLSSTAGAQYFWSDRVFSWAGDHNSFAYQLFHTYPPGTVDTSFISTDSINNPRTMNAVYNLIPRLLFAKQTGWGKEKLAGGSLNNKQFNDFVPNGSGPLATLFQGPDTVWTPRVLKDGSDSVGALAALNRVYFNIGLFSEEWLLHFRALVGGKPTTPIEIKSAEKNSVYWQATEAQTPDMAVFLAKASAPHHLKDAPGGSKYLNDSAATVNSGKLLFADNCARCHSSKLPPPPTASDPVSCGAKDYLECWNRYWAWTQTDEYKKQMEQVVLADDFLTENVLSTDLRVPVTLLQTNLCSPLATNAIAGNVWDNFSSQTYKDLPSVGTATYYDPVTGKERSYQMPAGGRGYTRPPSLVSVWATAPYLLNNSLGDFDPSPSVESRMNVFNTSIRQLLWPERRAKDRYLKNIPGKMDRTDAISYLRIPEGYLPAPVRGLLGTEAKLFPWLFDKDGPVPGIELGPFPVGMPVGLVSNLEIALDDATWTERLARDRDIFSVALKLKDAIRASRAKLGGNASVDIAEVPEFTAPELIEPLLKLSKCPDYTVNRGHYFGTDLSDADKEALIAFLKTF